MCVLHGRKGHVCVWDGGSSYLKVEGVQVSVTLCFTCFGVLVCIHPVISDLRLQFCHDSSDICLYTREPLVSAAKVMCAAGVGGNGKAL